MNSKLEKKLRQYEKSTPITNDHELMGVLEYIIAEENKKSANDRDYDIIDEAIDAVLTLRGDNVEALEAHAAECTGKYIGKVKKTTAQISPKTLFSTVKIKRLIPIVAVLTVIFMTTIVSYTSGYDWFTDAFNRVKHTFDENERALSAGDYYEFSSIEELSSISEYEGLLLPSKLPEGFSYKRISAQKARAKVEKNTFIDYTVVSIITTKENSWQEVSVKSSAVSDTVEGELARIGGFNLIYYREGNRHCGTFESDGYTYTVSAATLVELNRLLYSLPKSITKLSEDEETKKYIEVLETPNITYLSSEEDICADVKTQTYNGGAETSSGLITTANKYDYQDENVIVLDITNYTSKNYTLTIEGIYKDVNGEKIKSEKQIYDGFSAGWSNCLIFDPGIKFDSFSFEVTAEEYTGKTFSNYVEFGNIANCSVSWLPSDGSGKLVIPTSPEHHATLSNYVTLFVGVRGVSTYPEKIKYKGEVVVFDSLNDIWCIQTPGIQGNVPAGEIGLSIYEMTDEIWEDGKHYELPKKLQNATGAVAVKYVVKCGGNPYEKN